jgi:hypothetical protein
MQKFLIRALLLGLKWGCARFVSRITYTILWHVWSQSLQKVDKKKRFRWLR